MSKLLLLGFKHFRHRRCCLCRSFRSDLCVNSASSTRRKLRWLRDTFSTLLWSRHRDWHRRSGNKSLRFSRRCHDRFCWLCLCLWLRLRIELWCRLSCGLSSIRCLFQISCRSLKHFCHSHRLRRCCLLLRSGFRNWLSRGWLVRARCFFHV